MNGFIKKGPLWFLISLAAVFSLYIIIKYAIFACTEPPVTVSEETEIQRGSILDRNGKALAVPANFYHFGVTPSAIKDKKTFASLVSPLVGLSESEIISTIEKNPLSSFVYIKKKLDQGTYDELKKIISRNALSSAVRFDKIPGRVYPENDLASQLVGFMGADGKGLAGIE